MQPVAWTCWQAISFSKDDYDLLAPLCGSHGLFLPLPLILASVSAYLDASQPHFAAPSASLGSNLALFACFHRERRETRISSIFTLAVFSNNDWNTPFPLILRLFSKWDFLVNHLILMINAILHALQIFATISFQNHSIFADCEIISDVWLSAPPFLAAPSCHRLS